MNKIYKYILIFVAAIIFLAIVYELLSRSDESSFSSNTKYLEITSDEDFTIVAELTGDEATTEELTDFMDAGQDGPQPFSVSDSDSKYIVFLETNQDSSVKVDLTLPNSTTLGSEGGPAKGALYKTALIDNQLVGISLGSGIVSVKDKSNAVTVDNYLALPNVVDIAAKDAKNFLYKSENGRYGLIENSTPSNKTRFATIYIDEMKSVHKIDEAFLIRTIDDDLKLVPSFESGGPSFEIDITDKQYLVTGSVFSVYSEGGAVVYNSSGEVIQQLSYSEETDPEQATYQFGISSTSFDLVLYNNNYYLQKGLVLENIGGDILNSSNINLPDFAFDIISEDERLLIIGNGNLWLSTQDSKAWRRLNDTSIQAVIDSVIIDGSTAFFSTIDNTNDIHIQNPNISKIGL